MSPAIGTRSLHGHINNLGQKNALTPKLHDLEHIVSLEHEAYGKFTSKENSDLVGDALCRHVESAVRSEDILNLQFTSGKYVKLPEVWSQAYHIPMMLAGTTGSPKAAMLSHM